jgi:hypothetical protein
MGANELEPAGLDDPKLRGHLLGTRLWYGHLLSLKAQVI